MSGYMHEPAQSDFDAAASDLESDLARIEELVHGLQRAADNVRRTITQLRSGDVSADHFGSIFLTESIALTNTLYAVEPLVHDLGYRAAGL